MSKRFDKKYFEKVQKLAVEWHNLKSEFDVLLVKRFGYHYSAKDLDEIIDSIDYGGGGMTYERFLGVMEKGKDMVSYNE